MLRPLRAAWRLLRVAVHVLHGLAIVRWRFGALDAAGRRERVLWWSRALLRHLGITLVVQGTPRTGAKLFVANHISWLDIVAINATAPARFVSKAEVRHWPVLHQLVTAAGTLYLERDKRRDALRVVHQVAQALQDGDTVAVFPEGTTGTGHQLLPFHANLLQAAIATSTPVQPIALRYSDHREAVSSAVAYVGDTTIVQSLWWVACADGLQVTVRLLEPLGSRHADRRALAQHARDRIEHALNPVQPT
ncbi:MAG: lysophospholipid acyltransferase family protein [Caldimonas sp.]|uniref:lysophospholipid acyltransferase family protein n=1 Tax=Caldimonas sp. TaxID=2838790 RepID=UPI00391CC940